MRMYGKVIVTVAAVLSVGARAAGGGIETAHGAVAARPAPKTLTLTVADVKRVTGESFSGSGAVVTNSVVASEERVSVAEMNRYRLAGYVTIFLHVGGTGILDVTDSVGLYKSTSAAKWEYKLFTKENPMPKGGKKLSMSGIGTESHGYTHGSKHGTSEVYLQRGVWTARIDIADAKAVPASVMLSLARILDGREQKAG
jgi:hypothetical protein